MNEIEQASPLYEDIVQSGAVLHEQQVKVLMDTMLGAKSNIQHASQVADDIGPLFYQNRIDYFEVVVKGIDFRCVQAATAQSVPMYITLDNMNWTRKLEYRHEKRYHLQGRYAYVGKMEPGEWSVFVSMKPKEGQPAKRIVLTSKNNVSRSMLKEERDLIITAIGAGLATNTARSLHSGLVTRAGLETNTATEDRGNAPLKVDMTWLHSCWHEIMTHCEALSEHVVHGEFFNNHSIELRVVKYGQDEYCVNSEEAEEYITDTFNLQSAATIKTVSVAHAVNVKSLGNGSSLLLSRKGLEAVVVDRYGQGSYNMRLFKRVFLDDLVNMQCEFQRSFTVDRFPCIGHRVQYLNELCSEVLSQPAINMTRIQIYSGVANPVRPTAKLEKFTAKLYSKIVSEAATMTRRQVMDWSESVLEAMNRVALHHELSELKSICNSYTNTVNAHVRFEYEFIVDVEKLNASTKSRIASLAGMMMSTLCFEVTQNLTKKVTIEEDDEMTSNDGVFQYEDDYNLVERSESPLVVKVPSNLFPGALMTYAKAFIAILDYFVLYLMREKKEQLTPLQRELVCMLERLLIYCVNGDDVKMQHSVMRLFHVQQLSNLLNKPTLISEYYRIIENRGLSLVYSFEDNGSWPAVNNQMIFLQTSLWYRSGIFNPKFRSVARIIGFDATTSGQLNVPHQGEHFITSRARHYVFGCFIEDVSDYIVLATIRRIPLKIKQLQQMEASIRLNYNTERTEQAISQIREKVLLFTQFKKVLEDLVSANGSTVSALRDIRMVHVLNILGGQDSSVLNRVTGSNYCSDMMKRGSNGIFERMRANGTVGLKSNAVWMTWTRVLDQFIQHVMERGCNDELVIMYAIEDALISLQLFLPACQGGYFSLGNGIKVCCLHQDQSKEKRMSLDNVGMKMPSYTTVTNGVSESKMLWQLLRPGMNESRSVYRQKILTGFEVIQSHVQSRLTMINRASPFKSVKIMEGGLLYVFLAARVASLFQFRFDRIGQFVQEPGSREPRYQQMSGDDGRYAAAFLLKWIKVQEEGGNKLESLDIGKPQPEWPKIVTKSWENYKITEKHLWHYKILVSKCGGTMKK